jgi:hypothetical protein
MPRGGDACTVDVSETVCPGGDFRVHKTGSTPWVISSEVGGCPCRREDDALKGEFSLGEGCPDPNHFHGAQIIQAVVCEASSAIPLVLEPSRKISQAICLDVCSLPALGHSALPVSEGGLLARCVTSYLGAAASYVLVKAIELSRTVQLDLDPIRG